MGLSICFGVSFTNVVFGAIVFQFIILTIIVYNLQNN